MNNFIPLSFLLLLTTNSFAQESPVRARLVLQDNKTSVFLKIPKDQVLYHQSLEFSYEKANGAFYKPKPKNHDFLNTRVLGYKNSVTIPFSLTMLKEDAVISVKYQTCNVQKKVCYLPKNKKLSLKPHHFVDWQQNAKNTINIAHSNDDINAIIKAGAISHALPIIMMSVADCVTCSSLLQTQQGNNNNISFILWKGGMEENTSFVKENYPNAQEFILLALSPSLTVIDSTTDKISTDSLTAWLHQLQNKVKQKGLLL